MCKHKWYSSTFIILSQHVTGHLAEERFEFFEGVMACKELLFFYNFVLNDSTTIGSIYLQHPSDLNLRDCHGDNILMIVARCRRKDMRDVLQFLVQEAAMYTKEMVATISSSSPTSPG